MNSVTLLTGATIYRARATTDSSPALRANVCNDTDKTGLYFSDDPRLCLGMSLEYNYDIYLYEYRVVKPIVLFESKYGFRNINPERYFKDGCFIPNVNIIDEENINHYDNGAVPIFDGVQQSSALGEIFIREHDLPDRIEFIGSMFFSVSRVQELLT